MIAHLPIKGGWRELLPSEWFSKRAKFFYLLSMKFHKIDVKVPEYKLTNTLTSDIYKLGE